MNSPCTKSFKTWNWRVSERRINKLLFKKWQTRDTHFEARMMIREIFFLSLNNNNDNSIYAMVTRCINIQFKAHTMWLKRVSIITRPSPTSPLFPCCLPARRCYQVSQCSRQWSWASEREKNMINNYITTLSRPPQYNPPTTFFFAHSMSLSFAALSLSLAQLSLINLIPHLNKKM